MAVKTCPVCKTKLFEDMDTCFGCMHRFDTDADSGVRQRDDVEGEVRIRVHREKLGMRRRV